MRKELIIVNQFAWEADKKGYLLYMLCALMQAGEIFVTMASTEYIINAASALIDMRVSFREITSWIICYTCLIMFFRILSNMRMYYSNRLTLAIEQKFYREFHEKLTEIEWEYFENHETFLKIHEVRENTVKKIEAMLKNTVQYLLAVPMMLIFGFYLGQIHIGAVLLYLVLVVVFNLIIAGKLFAQLGNYWEELQPYTQKQKYFFGICGDKVSHQEYRFLRLFSYASGLWERFYDKEYQVRLKIYKKWEITLQSARLIFNLPYILMLVFIGYEVMIGRHEVGFLVMANSLLNYIIDTCFGIQQSIMDDQGNSRFIRIWQEVLAFREAKKTETNLKRIPEKLVFSNVNYQYPQSERWALQNLNLQIRKGEKLAIVGVNGSGKTTFTNLLMGLIPGHVPTDMQEKVSCLVQDFAQYQMSIRENISCGNPGKVFSEEELWNLLEQVGLKSEIEKLPKGLDTSLGQLENGMELSKGQWQRLAIARLLAKERAELWILDEPTAYLDPISEIEIYDLIYRLAGERTVLFISHRLGFAKRADRILVFDNGSITEEGTHEHLIRREGTYEQLYKTQEAWYS